MKMYLTAALKATCYEVVDLGALALVAGDDYPDVVAPLARALASGEFIQGIAVCGSGVGASIAANKVPGLRAALITDSFTAHHGMEDNNVNIICLDGQVVGHALAGELVGTFLKAQFNCAERHRRRLTEMAELETRVIC